MPLPELDLTMRYETRFLSEKWNDREDEKIVVREDTHFQKHTIEMLISDQEIGKVQLSIGGHTIELPTYKLTVTDTKTGEKSSFEITRDVLRFSKEEIKRSFFSFFGINKFNKINYLYENISFEPQKDTITHFELERYRSLSQEKLVYFFKGSSHQFLLYAGGLEHFQIPNSEYYIIVDGKNGQSFIADILYREKMLKFTPKVELKLIQRKKIAKEFSFDSKGKLNKLVYL